MTSRNQQIRGAREYHASTAHSPQSVRTSGHRLDWDIKPAPFKLYPDLPVIPLPRDIPRLDLDALAALSPSAPAHALDLDRLAALLFFSAGVTKHMRYPGGAEVYFRAAPSTGALYQTEVYVVAGDVSGLEAGVYHFSPGDLALRRLRAGDFRGAVALAAADEAMAARPATIVLSAIYSRNTWKYQARGYRHLFWDSGTMLSQVVGCATALGLPMRIETAFVETEVHALLGLDASSEGALALAVIGARARPAPVPPVIAPLHATVVPLSTSVVEYPLLVQAYADSSLDSEAEVLDWREHARASSTPAAGSPRDVVPLPAPRRVAGRSLGETIHARGSTREFSGEPIAAEHLSTALFYATREIPWDAGAALVDLYLTVHSVDGVTPGAYRYDRAAHGLELLKLGDFRAESARLCLEQPLGGASSATVFFLSDLDRALGDLGNRGYRAVNLEAGIAGGRLYLCAYAQRFGATGLTFYDGEVVRFFSPHAARKDAIFVTALGRSTRHAPQHPAPLRIERLSR